MHKRGAELNIEFAVAIKSDPWIRHHAHTITEVPQSRSGARGLDDLCVGTKDPGLENGCYKHQQAVQFKADGIKAAPRRRRVRSTAQAGRKRRRH